MKQCDYQGECGKCEHPKAQEYNHLWCVGTDCCKHQKQVNDNIAFLREQGLENAAALIQSDIEMALIAEDYSEVMEGIGVR